jgi:putative endonuclease
MKRYYVYILFCSDESYYTGITNDLEKRLNEHNSSDNIFGYTSKRKPVKLAFFEEFMDVKQALELEKQIKGWSRRKKEALINEDWEKLVLFSKNYSQHSYMICPPSTSSG